jgi:hypothetical protein
MKKNKKYFSACLIFFLTINCFSQKEIAYKATEFIVFDENGKEKNLTALQKKNFKKDMLAMKFYVTEFDNQAFLKDKYESKNPLRLKKVSSFLNSTEYFFDEEYMSWKLKITKYPFTNELRIEIEAPDAETGKNGTVVITGKEI